MSETNQIIMSNDNEFRYPRLQINKHGEIVLATGMDNKYKLTTGILVAKTPDSKSKVPIGKKFDDWEVVGELKDYDGQITVQFENKFKST